MTVEENKASIKAMQKSLKKWLRFRKANDAAATGMKKAKAPMAVVAQRVSSARDWALEKRMAENLYAMLSEFMDARDLPDPRSPNAAVTLAEIVVAGKLPEDVGPQATGLVWLWPVAIIAGSGAYAYSSKVQADAETAQYKEKVECIELGTCTDYGFWLKLASVAFIGWFAWEKLGVKKKVKQLTA
jgi:hypothetical protein